MHYPVIRAKPDGCIIDPTRTDKRRLRVTGEDERNYFAKVWNSQNYTINYHNQSRGILAHAIAERIGVQELLSVVRLQNVVDEDVLGTEIVSSTDCFDDCWSRARNSDDIPRIVFLDLLLLNNDRKRRNSNLIWSTDDRLLMVDFDNFCFDGANYSTAKSARRQFLEDHPLLAALRRRPDDVREALRELARRACNITDEWLADVQHNMPSVWYEHGGGPELFDMSRQARADGPEVSELIRSFLD